MCWLKPPPCLPSSNLPEPAEPLERIATLFSVVQLPISSRILTLQNTVRTAQEMKNKCRCCGCKGQPASTAGCSLPPVFIALKIRFKIIKHFFFFFFIYSLFPACHRKVSSSASKEEFPSNQNIPNTASSSVFLALLLLLSLFTAFSLLLFTHMLMHYTFQSITCVRSYQLNHSLIRK